MPQSNIYALASLASFIIALLVAKLWTRVVKGEFPGGKFVAIYLRMLIGFLVAAAAVFGFRSLQ